ncbi:MAG: transcription factor S [Nitrososphaerota archaeon]|nr:transcription factor S [Nitrososphaerota archaeon]
MDFCPKCNSRMKPRQIKIEDKAVIALVCPKCGYSSNMPDQKGVEISDEASTASIKVVGDEADKLKTMPVTTIECPKCGNMEAQWWFLQTRSGDEPPTQFYRCTACGHTWRQYA